MTITAEAARELAKWLNEVNQSGRSCSSWRKIADRYTLCPDGSRLVKAGTLCRIATTEGEWLPKSKEILTALGLIKLRTQEPQPEWLKRRKKAIRRMVKDTKKAVIRK